MEGVHFSGFRVVLNCSQGGLVQREGHQTWHRKFQLLIDLLFYSEYAHGWAWCRGRRKQTSSTWLQGA